MGKIMAVGVGAILAGFVAWLFWGPLLHFLWSLIPATAQYAWIGKLACLIAVGYLGGIGLPLVIFVGIIVVAIQS